MNPMQITWDSPNSVDPDFNEDFELKPWEVICPITNLAYHRGYHATYGHSPFVDDDGNPTF